MAAVTVAVAAAMRRRRERSIEREGVVGEYSRKRGMV